MKELYKRILAVDYIHLDEETASYCTEKVDGTLFIYFEWSNGATDWKNNFDFPAKPYREMKNKWYAHRGFLKVWKAIEPHLQEQINDKSIREFVIAGYSHGAAIALLCYEYCKFNRPDAVTTGYGYGAPRVVWGFLRKAVKNRLAGFTVIRNGNDIVTRVPPVWLGYRHAGKVLHIGRGKGYNAIEAHYSENYIKELSE